MHASQNFAGDSLGFRAILALATPSPGNQSLLANAGRHADHVEEAGRLLTSLHLRLESGITR